MSNNVVVVSELKRPKVVVDFSDWDPGMVARHESVLKNGVLTDSPVAKAQHSPPVQQPYVPVTPADERCLTK